MISDMISGISIVCFAASYGVALALEVSRLFFRISVRTAAAIGMASAGLIAHALYLGVQFHKVAAAESPLASWFHWCLVAAWVLAAVYIGLAVARPKTATGVFMLPLVLVLVAVAYPFQDTGPLPPGRASSYWGMIHGVTLLLGTAVVMLGFATGVMYLVQSYRLKHKLPPRQGLRLPSLEWLQRVNGRSTIVSTCLLGPGLLIGIVLNVGEGPLPWTDPVVCTSGLLLAWLLVVSLFELFYEPARRGAKVAYLTVASFIILALVVSILLFGPSKHPGSKLAGVSRPEVSDDAADGRL